MRRKNSWTDPDHRPKRPIHIQCLFACLILLLPGTTAAQTVSGTVTDQDGEALIGVSVIQRGTNSGTVTDLDGTYSLTLSAEGDQALRFSYTGFATITRQVGTRTVIDVTMEPDAQLLDEVVVVGYGTERKRDVLGAISSIDDDQVTQVTPVTAFDAIQGRLAGVQISTNGGPGAGADIRIRGTSTFSGGVSPLYVVDGQQLDNIDNLDPNDIESIEVLKDGASAAIYGSKSANGVVIITTKGGRSGQLAIDINHATTFSSLFNKIPVANTKERVAFERLRNGANVVTTDSDSLSARFQQVVDIQDEVTRMAVRNQTNLSISGGGDNSRFYWNTGYLDEEGIIVNSFYKRINSNLKVDFNINPTISAGTRVNASYEFAGGLNENSVFRQLSERPAYLPVRDFNGDLFPEVFGRQNPLAEALETVRDDRNFRAQLFSWVELKILPGLNFKSTLGTNYRFRKRNDFDPTIVVRPGNPPTGRERNDLLFDWQQENFFTYTRDIGKHKVGALAGMQLQKWTDEYTELRAVSFSSDLIETFNNASELNTSATRTLKDRHALASVFGRLTYNYAGKYLLAGTLRRDGSSRFGANRRYGNFPSVSAGWRISAEPFMEGLSGVISDLKVRASYAVTGNERIGNYDARLLYSPGFIYNGVNGLAPTQLSNPSLGWESTEQVNYGIDLSLLEGRFNATADFYTKTTNDLLYNVPLPDETGFSSVRQNIGSVENSGIELTLSGTPLRLGDFRWFTSFNIATNDNVVLELADEDGFESGAFIIQEGESLGNFYGFRNLGVFSYDESNAFTPDGMRLTPNFDADGNFVDYSLDGRAYSGEVNQLTANGRVLGGGDVIWDDVNGDFNITSADDRQVIGNGYAKVFGGFFNEFTYKELSLSVLFDYNFGNDIYRNYDDRRNTATSFGGTPHPDRINNAWRNQGDDAEYPSLDRRRSQNRLGFDSQYVSQGDFIKLRNVRLAYSLPNSFTRKLNWMRSLSLFVSVNNPVTWTNYQGYNPELGTRGNPLQPGFDNLRYPNKTDVILGARLGL